MEALATWAQTGPALKLHNVHMVTACMRALFHTARDPMRRGNKRAMGGVTCLKGARSQVSLP